MIDLHCHLIPGVDDGPPTLTSALALARALVEDGVRQVVATPHLRPSLGRDDWAAIQAAHARLQRALREACIALRVRCAAEVQLTAETLPWLDRPGRPFVGQHAGAATMLMELPATQVPVGTEVAVERLVARRIRPILAHPERHQGLARHPQRLAALVRTGCFVQVTAGSLIGQFGKEVSATARAMVDAGLVHVIASDAHDIGRRRPRMSEARDWLARHHGEATARQLTLDGPAMLCRVSASAAPAAQELPHLAFD